MGILTIAIMPFCLMTLAKNTFIYIHDLKTGFLPSPVYAFEKKLDMFSPSEAPKGSFKVIPFDLNGDGTKELFVSNPDNNGFFTFFWRIYQYENKTYQPIAEMGCTSIRISSRSTNDYNDVQCYSYLSLAEGYLRNYKFFGGEYQYEDTKRVNSREYYDDVDFDVNN